MTLSVPPVKLLAPLTVKLAGPVPRVPPESVTEATLALLPVPWIAPLDMLTAVVAANGLFTVQFTVPPLTLRLPGTAVPALSERIRVPPGTEVRPL